MCKAHIEKSEGCNHMTCYYCEFQFCWICGGTYTPDHFTAFNPFGCSGQQFSSSNPANTALRVLWLYLRRFLLFLVFLIVAPIVLVFAAPIACVAFCLECTKSCWRYNNSCWCTCIYFLIVIPPVFALGLAADVVVVPLAIVIGIPFFIYYTISQRMYTWNNAKERLA
jgi:hypothetical protein